MQDNFVASNTFLEDTCMLIHVHTHQFSCVIMNQNQIQTTSMCVTPIFKA